MPIIAIAAASTLMFTPAEGSIPLQQVDVRGGYTAAAGANFYTAENYPKKYRNQLSNNRQIKYVHGF